MKKVALVGAILAVFALIGACQDRASESAAPAPKPSSGTVSSNDKVSDAGTDH